MNKSIFIAVGLVAAGAVHAQAPALAPVSAAPAAAAASAPIVVAGTVADEASKAALLARLRTVYGLDRVVGNRAGHHDRCICCRALRRRGGRHLCQGSPGDE